MKLRLPWRRKPAEETESVEAKSTGEGGLSEDSRFRINRSIAELRVQITKLDRAYSDLKDRDKKFFKKCIAALEEGDEERAKIYANEAAEVTKLARAVLHGQLALEHVKLRLETILEVGDAVGGILPLLGVLDEIRDQVTDVLPGASAALANLSANIGGLMAPSPEPLTPQVADETKRILESANVVASERLRESFPEPPPAVHGLEEAERQVLEYIDRSPEEFSISECASALGLTKNQVISSVESLRRKGLITIEEKAREAE